MKSYLLSMENPSSMSGDSSSRTIDSPFTEILRGDRIIGINHADERLRTEPIEGVPTLTVRDPKVIPTGDVMVSESNQNNSLEEMGTAESKPAQIEASKNKGGGGKKGGKGKGKGGGGGGQNNGGGKQGGKGNDDWNDAEKVQTAIDEWRSERIDTDAKILEQQPKEDGSVVSMEMERLQKRKEILEKRIAKGDAKISLEKLKKDLEQLEKDKIELLREMQPLGEDIPGNLKHRKEELDLLIDRAKREYAEALSVFVRDHKDVKFSDSPRDGIQTAPEYLDLGSTKGQSSRIVQRGKNVLTVVGATFRSMLEMSGGFLKTLWKSWNAHVDKPNTVLGGQKLKDFLLEEQKKKK